MRPSRAEELAAMAETRHLRAEAEARLTRRILTLAQDPESGGPMAIARNVGASHKTVTRILRAHGVQCAGKGGAA